MKNIEVLSLVPLYVDMAISLTENTTNPLLLTFLLLIVLLVSSRGSN